jgi:hypothetical protein
VAARNDHEEVAMNHIHRIRRIAVLLSGMAAAALTFGATSPAAFAEHVPPAGGSGPPGQAPAQVHTVVIGGMPGWQIALIAVGTALLAAALAVLFDRARTARRHLTAPTT